MAVVNEVSTVSHIPQFVPFGLLYYTQDTGDLYIGTGFSTGSDYVGGNPGPNVNVELVSSPGGLPGGFNGDIQYNNNGNLGGSAATITAAGTINIPTGQNFEINGVPIGGGSAAWSALTGDLTETQVIPWDGGTVGTPDTGISRLGPAFLAIGNGLAGDFTGTLRLKVLSIETAGVGVETLSLDAVTGLMQTSGGLEVGGALSSSGAFQSVGLASVGTTAIAAGATGGQLILQPSGGNASSVGWEENGVALRGALGFAAASSTLIYQSGVKTLTGTTVFGIGSTGNLLIGGTDTGVSRLAAASLAIGNGTAGNTSGNLSLNRVNVAGADYAGTVTITAAATTQAVTYAANYTGTAAPVVVVTPTSDPLALGVPVGYWVTPTGGAGAWTGFTMNIQTALAGNVTFNYVAIGKA
jgi:hypothetical protein